MPTIFIDNKPYEVKPGKNLLEAALSLGFDLPYFCWHPAMGSVGACRQCAVKVFKDEEDTRGRIVMSCMENASDGVRFSIADESARGFREQVIEWLMTNHPHDCPVCDEGGSCHLQDMTVMTGHDYRRYEFKKRTYTNQYLGPLIHHEMNRCIQCYRCVRFYRDYAGGDDLNVFAAHNHVYFGREKDGVLQSPFSGNLAEICPTGVFTDKTLKEHYTRKWDLTMAPSVCHHCSLGCNIIAGERYGEIRCVTNRYNHDVNGYFICDRGRFGYEFINSENRISQPVIRNQTFEAADENTLLNHLEGLLSQGPVIGIGSPRASMESNFALMSLVGEGNFYQGVDTDESFLQNQALSILQSGTVHSPSLKEIEQADAILVLGEDIWNTAPILALAVRQAVMKTGASKALEQHSALPHWHDAAVRGLMQEEKGFLANLFISGSPINDIASCTMQDAPDNLALAGFAIASRLDHSLQPVQLEEKTLQDVVKRITIELANAKRPVIIAGTSTGNDALIKAACNIATALNKNGSIPGLCYVFPECNSMGLALLKAPAFNHALTRVQHERGTTAVILENDLYYNMPAAMADAFFKLCNKVVVLDSLHNATTEKADVLIPAATFAEADGTLVNNEGRAQRFYQVFVPRNKMIRESWRWLMEIRRFVKKETNGREYHPNDLLSLLEKQMPHFAGISGVALPPEFSVHGEAIPREPHRYSGRTAMLANLNVSEPKPLQDEDSPYSFTMEGFRGIPPMSPAPFFWAPGWNSVQSVNKYQQEVGGPLRGHEQGVRLFKKSAEQKPVPFTDYPSSFRVREGKWLLVPKSDVFGSSELAVYTKAIEELSPAPFASLSGEDAEKIGAKADSTITVETEEDSFDLPLRIEEGLTNGILVISKGLRSTGPKHWGSWVSVRVKS